MSTTSTCFCGAVQLSYSIDGGNIPENGVFTCHCTDEGKITSSMFATNFFIKKDTLKHVRGEEKLTKYSQSRTIESGNTMTNCFCSICGSLMYRISSGSPDMTILRAGQVDDQSLLTGPLRPTIEQFTRSRVGWQPEIEKMQQIMGNYYF